MDASPTTDAPNDHGATAETLEPAAERVVIGAGFLGGVAVLFPVLLSTGTPGDAAFVAAAALVLLGTIAAHAWIRTER